MLGLAFAILNSWTALSASLSLALPSGGSTSVIWGLVTAGICNLCLAASLAEMLSAYPTAGGQYHFVAMIAWPRSVPILSRTTKGKAKDHDLLRAGWTVYRIHLSMRTFAGGRPT